MNMLYIYKYLKHKCDFIFCLTYFLIYICQNTINKLELPYNNDTSNFPSSMEACCKYNMEKNSLIKMVE